MSRLPYVLAAFVSVLVVGMSHPAAADQPFGDEALDMQRPHHEDAQTAPRLSAYLPVHGGSSLRLHYDTGASPNAALGPAIGAGVRFEIPLMKYLSIGLLGEFLSFQVDGNRDSLGVDADVMIKGRYVFGLTTNVDLEAYGFVPIGLSWMHFGRGAAAALDNGVGLNVGFQGGVTAIFKGRYGLFTDVGVRHRRIYTEETNLKVHVTSAQFVWSLGATLLF